MVYGSLQSNLCKHSIHFGQLLMIFFIHRWCHDIGREQAANKPLLKTVFQVAFSHEFTFDGYSIFEISHFGPSCICRS